MQYECGVGAVMHYLRRENRYRERHRLIDEPGEGDESQDDPSDPMEPVDTSTPESVTEMREMLERMWTAVDAMPPQERELIRNRFYSGKSVNRIAAELGVTRKIVWKRLKSAIETLRAGIVE